VNHCYDKYTFRGGFRLLLKIEWRHSEWAALPCWITQNDFCTSTRWRSDTPVGTCINYSNGNRSATLSAAAPARHWNYNQTILVVSNRRCPPTPLARETAWRNFISPVENLKSPVAKLWMVVQNLKSLALAVVEAKKISPFLRYRLHLTLVEFRGAIVWLWLVTGPRKAPWRHRLWRNFLSRHGLCRFI